MFNVASGRPSEASILQRSLRSHLIVRNVVVAASYWTLLLIGDLVAMRLDALSFLGTAFEASVPILFVVLLGINRSCFNLIENKVLRILLLIILSAVLAIGIVYTSIIAVVNLHEAIGGRI